MGNYKVPFPVNEPIYSYAPGSPERDKLKAAIERLKKTYIEAPMIIDGKEVKTANKAEMTMPHDHKKSLGQYFIGGKAEVESAIAAALKAKPDWENMRFEDRAAIFLKAAELIAGPYRYEFSAATILAHDKNVFQSEIDAICESIDFLRYNVYFAQQIYDIQPGNDPQMWNRIEYRPLEGFIVAVTPFNFVSIGVNLPTSAALMGNTVVWKPASSVVYTAHHFMKILKEAGLPDGVINLVTAKGADITNTAFKHRDLGGIHFTGSTEVFQNMWKVVGDNIANYKSYPKLVGETGGKDFVFVHESAEPHEVATAIFRGAFEYQGQKCSAASRSYIPKSLWPEIKDILVGFAKEAKMGPPDDFSNFINAVIDRNAFNSIKAYIDYAKKSNEAQIIFGGSCDDSVGYFIEPTLVLTTNPHFKLMEEEIFGPVMTVYVYENAEFEKMLEVCNTTSPYGLTGAIFARDRKAIVKAFNALRHAAGNFYINDKPTGAVVGRQPFGGARASGTNDKAGSMFNLLRWISPRTIKENFVPPRDYKYPFLG